MGGVRRLFCGWASSSVSRGLILVTCLFGSRGLIPFACAKPKELRPVYTVLQRAAPVTTNVLRRSYGLSHR